MDLMDPTRTRRQLYVGDPTMTAYAGTYPSGLRLRGAPIIVYFVGFEENNQAGESPGVAGALQGAPSIVYFVGFD